MESPVVDSRDTSVVVVTLDSGEVHIVVSLSSRSDTQVIYVDPTTGVLRYKGMLCEDVFNSEREALDFITNGSRLMWKSINYAKAILGYAALGSFGLLLVATKLSRSIPDLPGGGSIYTVLESQWIKISLHSPQPQGKGEVKNIQELTEVDIDGKHYFCEHRDITRPFPSQDPLDKPDNEFVWNGWLSVPFKYIGLPQHCVILLQGFAECRSFGSLGQKEGIIALIARRSRLHPGTRYLARGINSCFSTGNEVECEQVVWVPRKTGQSVPFSTYIWRRGTIPIWWGAELKITAAEAEIYVAEHEPYRGSAQYYKRLSKRYDTRKFGVFSTGGNQKGNSLVPIYCINLLKYGEGKSESILVQHFEESLNYVRSSGQLLDTKIVLINYDWHGTVKLRGEQLTIEGLWRLLKAPTISIGTSEGDYLPSRQRLSDCRGEVFYTDEYVGAFCLRTRQNGVLRFNCADSLDRTNAASYFGSLQVFVEQCRRLGISLDSDMSFGCQPVDNYGGYIAPLPPGWEKRSDGAGRTLFIDHNTKTTSWNHPCPDKPWKRFDMSFEEFKRSTILSPISQLAGLFLLAGDIHATLYTGSKAMHSQVLSIFTEEGGKFKQFSAAQNMKITLQRRYKNTIVDSSRQKQLEMFIGIRLFKHLPSIPLYPLHVLSRPPACFLKPVPNIFPSTSDGLNLLSVKRKELIWVCPQAANVVEVFLYLSEPCHVCELLLTVSHGSDDLTSPSTVDVRYGRDLDGLKLVLEGASIPQCANGTNIVIPLLGPVSSEDMAVTGAGARLASSEASHLSLLYDFEELEGELDFLTRVVALTFYPPISGKTPITLGEIEVLGVSLPWKGVFTADDLPAGLSPYQREKGVNDSYNPFSIDLDANGDLGSSISGKKVPTPVQAAVPSSNWLDLLTGESIEPGPMPQAEVHNSEIGGGDLLGFLDHAVNQGPTVTDNRLFQSQVIKSSTGGVKEYIEFAKFVALPKTGGELNFIEAMKLEIERLRLNLSAAERDRALLSIGIDPASINPNFLLDDHSIARLCGVSNSLAVLGQTAAEDKVTASIGLENVNGSTIDFWNVTGIEETCLGSMCEVRAEEKKSFRGSSSKPSGASESPFICSDCQRKVCRVCCAGSGAILLTGNYFKGSSGVNNGSGRGGSSHGNPADLGASQSVSPDAVVCKQCCRDIILYALSLDYVRVLISSRRSALVASAVRKALNGVVGFSLDGSLAGRGQPSNRSRTDKTLRQLLNGQESLAEFPLASFLHSVETAAGAAHPLSLLAPPDSGAQHSYWRAPSSCDAVEFAIVLSNLSDVSGVILVSPSGYSDVDAPMVQVWASNKISKEERSCVGKWDSQSLLTSSELNRPAKSDGNNVPRHLKIAFRNSVRCRMIWLTLRLPRTGSSSVNFGTDFNLLSLDENPFSQPNRRASSGGADSRDPCLHAKRIFVVGTLLKGEIGLTSSEGPDYLKLKSWLERPPKMNRFKVPIEVERLMDNDLVLEQFISPTSPLLAGFRLDAFSAIKPRATHSPSSTVTNWDPWPPLLEDRHVNPAVLYIQVSILQESHSMVTIAEYRLPVAKPGTAMYFDFPRQIQTQRVSFRLLGDIAAFRDDPSEVDDSDFRSSPVAAGLSLSNRIKLYYYADPYELGKWASLSAV